jgi:hypothetical protein
VRRGIEALGWSRQVNSFRATIESGGSTCHQLIMGSGKTTVVSPLLCLVLGDKNRLVVQVSVRPLSSASTVLTSLGTGWCVKSSTDGADVALQVVPPALLEFSRLVLRSSFGAVIPKTVSPRVSCPRQ